MLLFVTVCLPDPSVLPGHMITNIFLIFTVQLVLVGFEAYGLRLRRAISAFFYRKVKLKAKVNNQPVKLG